MRPLRLGVNIDHVATLRNARGHAHPDPLRAAQLALAAGADGITAHLREDRRHIVDDDIFRLAEMLAARRKPLNLEMAATEEMHAIALRIRPHAACIVPERREERTTEGGLDVAGQRGHLAPFVRALTKAGIRVSLFIEPESRQLDAAKAVGAPVVELHTGAYCEAKGRARARALNRLVRAARYAEKIPAIVELNIGHFLVGEAVFTGIESSIRRMRALMDEARAGAAAKPSAGRKRKSR